MKDNSVLEQIWNRVPTSDRYRGSDGKRHVAVKRGDRYHIVPLDKLTGAERRAFMAHDEVLISARKRNF